MSFDLKVRIYYEDTDAGGIIYHANYLRYAERARTEYLYHMGIPHKSKLGFVVTNADMKFKRPACLGDEIVVKTIMTNLGAASCEFSQNIYLDDVLLVEINIKVAFVNKELRPMRIPDNIREILKKEL